MGYFAWEYKGQHADLDKAYRQLLQYRESLLNPPLLIVSDLQRIVIHTNFTNTVKRVVELTLDDLLIPDKLDILRKAFTDPDKLRPGLTPSQVTEEAARHFARLAQLLRRYGNEPHATAHFLIRLLFCLFAEDVGILPGGLFTKLVTQPHRTAGAVSDQLRQLFAAMASGGSFGADEIPLVDGGLFNDDSTLDLDGDSLHILAEVSGLDWSSVEPSVLGTLFVRSLDPDKRSQLGAHYTSEADILLIVEPVLMAPLRRRWDEVKAEAEAKAEKRDLIAGSKPSPQKSRQLARIEAELFGLLRGFREELAAVQVLDAACGSGNFLYVALRLLLDLEWEVITLARDLGDSLAFPVVSPAQLHGIEINTYAYELAQTTIWIGYIQWWRDHGFGLPAEPILKPLDAIRQMDAILAEDRSQGTGVRSQETGVREPEWPAVDVIVGNPPFLGGKRIRQGVGRRVRGSAVRAFTTDASRAWPTWCATGSRRRERRSQQERRSGRVCWQRNSIRGGANRKVLERIKESGDIFWAHSDRDWVLDGAAVNVSMVGFDDGTETTRTLDGQTVSVQINSDLTATVDLTSANDLSENRRNLLSWGHRQRHRSIFTQALAQAMFAAPLNPNGRPNSDVLRPC